MIERSNFKDVILSLGFISKDNNVFTKSYPHFSMSEMRVDFNRQELIYPEQVTINDRTTSNFEHPENFVVFECVTRLLDKGYRPEHIELEKRWNLGHNAKGGKADICVYNQEEKVFLIIECKTAGKEYSNALKLLKEDGGQLFSYWQQERSAEWLSIYCSDWNGTHVEHQNSIIKCTDDANMLKAYAKDSSVRMYKNSHTVEELFYTWDVQYNKELYTGLIFGEDTTAYQIGVRALRKKDLQHFKPEDKIVNKFEEILRHNNVSDKENAFNRLVALFICKLVDEIQKGDNDEMDFQYRVGTDTYENLQDRLQRLHKEGMEKFMGEEINYIDDDYAQRLFSQQLNASHRKAAIEDLRNTIRILKYYSNNDFSFKDVHNEELFYQNGKVLVEVVELFERYRIVYPCKQQFLGDLFEQLLNKGFKQNEGQFFTPTPITRFIWDSLPLEKILHTEDGYVIPKIIDYACGAGHFLTEAVEAINSYFKHVKEEELVHNNLWVEHGIYGVEKDYRLARVAKVCLYMNGAGKGQIIFGDGLEQYKDKGIANGTFDILVANPPYSVDAFKAHLKLKDNYFDLLSRISPDGGEIETLFVERIAQLLKPKGIAAVILPVSILDNKSSSYVGARELLLQNFYIRAIASFGSKTFGATGTNTIICFLEKYNEPPRRQDIVTDSVYTILYDYENMVGWEDHTIFNQYLQKIGVTETDYRKFSRKELTKDELEEIEYFAQFVHSIYSSSDMTAFRKPKAFQQLTIEDKEKKELDFFYSKMEKIEQERLYYFGLVYNQTTLIITAPTDNADQKEFLGYEWSNRRGSEGIQIKTPGGQLYDDKNRYADNTLSGCVRKSFENQQQTLVDKEEYYSYVQLQDLIDFTHIPFTKAIKLAADKSIVVESKYEKSLLKDIAEVKKGSTITRSKAKEGKIKVIAGGTDFAYYHNKSNRPANTITISASGANAGYVNFWTEPIFASDCTTVRCNNEIDTKYILAFFKAIQNQLYSLQRGAAQPHVYPGDLEQVQIPMPPQNIREHIVTLVGQLDNEFKTSRMSIEDYSLRINQIFNSLDVIITTEK